MNTDNLYKLNTHEDKFHLHKILGVLALSNFIFRFSSYFIYGDMRFDILPHSILIHLLLPISSLIFKISSKRHESLAIIYPELRLHSIIFTARSVICYYLYYYNQPLYYRMIVCILTNISADIVTMLCGQKSTIRGVNMEHLNEKEERSLKISYSVSQILATLLMLSRMDNIFFVLFPIQYAAFGMTLVKKGIINSKIYNELYAWSLLLGYLFILDDTFSIVVFGISHNILSHLRLKCNMNKYLMWITYFLFYNNIYRMYIPDNMIFNYVVILGYVIKRSLKIYRLFHK